MATSWAQEVIICDLCPEPTHLFCNNCQVSLCVNCFSKHVDKFKSLAHDIVHFTNRKIQPVFPECEFHASQRCEAHCQQCDVHVCLKCIFGSHNGHNMMDIHEIFIEKKKEIENENQEIESGIILTYENKTKDTESKISKTTAKFHELEKETEKHRKLWQEEVNTIFNKLGSLIKSKREKYLTALNSHQSKLKQIIPDMIQTVKQNKEILKANRVSEVNNYTSRLNEYRDIPADIDVNIPSLNTKSIQGTELVIELGEYRAKMTQASLSSLRDEISYLTTTGLSDKARVIATIPTGVKPLWRVACVGADEVWVSGDDEVVRRVDVHGSVQESINTLCEFGPTDISVTREKELIYSDSINRTVNIVRHGRTEVMIIPPLDWRPYRLCCTRSGDILVMVSIHTKNKIIRYQGDTIKQEIDTDEHENPIFKEGDDVLAVAENNNGDICVSDCNADTLVVLDKTGRVRFRYDGTPARREKKFSPRHIVTDTMSQIIVTDLKNACLHIIHQNGQLLRCVDNCDLDQPFGLSVDSEGRLWVALPDSGEVKVIQYMK